MPESVNDLLAKDLEEIKVLPSFTDISNRCTRQMCRSGILEALSQQPDVHGLGIETVAILFDEASNLIGEMMLIVAKLYQEKGLPFAIEADVTTMRTEEAAKFGMGPNGEIKEEEEEWQSQDPQNKNLN